MPARRIRVLVFAALALLLPAACMHPTYYEPAADGEVYADQEIAEGRYRVTFAGNSATARETVENYLLYRAAEITLAAGRDYFVFAEYDVEREVTYRRFVDLPRGPAFYGPYGPWHPYWDGYAFGPFYDPFGPGYAEVTARETDKYRAYATIAVYSGTPPADDPDAYAARDVIDRLRGSIQRPETASES